MKGCFTPKSFLKGIASAIATVALTFSITATAELPMEEIAITVDPLNTPLTEFNTFQAEKTAAPAALFAPAAPVVYEGTTDKAIALVVNQTLYPNITTSIDRYIDDVQAEGYTVILHQVAATNTPASLKQTLISDWNSYAIVGAFLVGDVPVAWFESIDNWSGDNPVEVSYPSDYFYMDLDGTWEDSDNDGKYDVHTQDYAADIWIGRIYPKNLTTDLTEAELVNNYFNKNHAYRTGTMRLDDKSYTLINKDWINSGFDSAVSIAYTDNTILKEPQENVTSDAYRDAIFKASNNKYENILIASHSSYRYHTFNSGSSFQSTEIEENTVQANFYNLFACSSGRFIEQNALINWYTLQSEYGLNTIGTTKTGSMLSFQNYYNPLNEGNSLGESFLSWFQATVNTTDYRVAWHYGMVMSGDPTLKISRFMEPPACTEYTATNSEHEAAGRAYSETVAGYWWNPSTTTWYAEGSGENLGTSGTTVTTLYSSDGATFNEGSCPTPDLTAPVITILGEDPVEVYQNSDYVDAGATANDDRDGDITSSIVVTDNVNTALIGTYSVTYNVSDAAGNSTTKIRTVEVIPAPACVEYTDTNSNHESANRAYSETVAGYWWNPSTTTWYAEGSDENLGTSGSTVVTLRTNPNGAGYITGECPADPQPPVITSTAVSVVANQVTITGTATDPDNDITMSVHYFMGGGAECDGTTEFTCIISDLDPGNYEADVKVVDSGMRNSELVTVQFTIEEPTAPVMTLGTVNVNNGTLQVTGTVSDINNDITTIGIALPGPYGTDCTINGTDYLCEIDVSGYNPGTYPGGVTAFDSRSESDSVTFEFTVEEQQSEPPVITNVAHSVEGVSITVTADVTDVDGDLEHVQVVVTSEIGGFDCENIGGDSFRCYTATVTPRTYTMKVIAVDAANNQAESAEFTVTVEEPNQCVTATNQEHIDNNRAVLEYGVLVYTNGSHEYLGLTSASSTLFESSPGYWEIGQDCE